MPTDHPSGQGQPTDDGPPSAPRRRLLSRWWFRAIVFLMLIYGAWCAFLYFYQDKLLFPADLAPPPTPRLYDQTTEEIRLDIEGGGQAVAWFVPALAEARSKPAPLVIYFHGNAEIIDYQSTTVEGYRKLGFSVLLPEYRGYGRSAGKPSEGAIVADAVRFYDVAVCRKDVDPARVIFHGRSLGGGPAAALAARRRPAALILESTFASVASMAWGYGAPPCLASNPFHADHILETLDIPVLIFHGTHDDIIPVAHGRKLRDLARRGTYVEYDCKHNDFPGDGNEEVYWNEIGSLLRSAGMIASAPPSSSPTTQQ